MRPKPVNPNEAAEHAARANAPAWPDGGPAEQDATSSNTASNSYRDDFYFLPLRWGVDSIYLSYPGDLSPEMEDRLKDLKKAAQSAEAHEQVYAQFPAQGHIFEVKDKGAPLFPYVLEDNAFRIQLSRPGRKVPMAYVKVSSGYLSHVGPAHAEIELRGILDELGVVTDSAHVSRIDLFLDFVCTLPMDGWAREAWITRASSISNYSEGSVFTGWMIGAGGTISCRLYDKTQEIKKSHKDYLKHLWQQAGWDGELPVWRLEFQFRRELLDQWGVVKLDSVLRHLNGLWSYATTEWLRLAIPDPSDSNRSRWPLNPIWLAASCVDWETNGGPLTPRFSFSRGPGRDWIERMGLSVLTTFMAMEGVYDFMEGMRLLSMLLFNRYSSVATFEGIPFDQFILEKVQAKGRKYNTISNLEEIPNEDRIREELDAQAWEYRKASKGG